MKISTNQQRKLVFEKCRNYNLTVDLSKKTRSFLMIATNRILPFIFGLTMSVNFMLVWAIPIMGMGGVWKSVVKRFLLPLITALDQSPLLRNFAKKYIYTKPEHADFFLTSFLVIVNSIVSLSTVLYWQLTTGSLPYWLIFAYYCSWVGIGGRTMGGAYALAHKEVSVFACQSITDQEFSSCLS